LLLACYALLVATPLLPGIPPQVGSILATVVFAALSMALILSLARLRTAAWHELASLVVLAGCWRLLMQFAAAHETVRLYVGPAVGIAFMLACVCAGNLLSRIIRDRNILVPVCVVAMIADFYTVFAGPTGKALEQTPKLVQALSVAIPQVGSATGPAGARGLAHAATMGLGDIIFIAMFFSAAARFGFRLRRAYLGILIPTLVAIVAVLTVWWLPALPLLPFIAGGFLVASAREFHFSAEEKRNLKWVGLILLVATAILVLFWLRSAHS